METVTHSKKAGPTAGSVVIGGGIAGMQAAATLRIMRPDEPVTLVDVEREVGYYRTLLPQFMNRSLPEEKLFFCRQSEDHLLGIFSGVAVTSIDRANRCLLLDNNDRLPYRRLLIASGGRPIIPPVCRPDLCQGIFPIRSLSVARAARAWLNDHPKVVIVGGGLVGVKTAAHLAGYGFSVTLVEREKQLLPQALSPAAAQLIQSHLEAAHVDLHLGVTVQDIQQAKGMVTAVQVDDRWLACQTLLLAAGSVPEVGLLKDSGLLQDGRLEVTSMLQTADARIFGAGDVVTIVDDKLYTPWTWPQAAVQGRLAAANLCSENPTSLNCLSRVNAMNLKGLSLAILGVPVPGAAVMRHVVQQDGVYRELFLQDGKIVGGVLLGDISGVGRLHAILNRGGQVVPEDVELLRPRLKVFSHYTPTRRRLVRRVAATAPGELRR